MSTLPLTLDMILVLLILATTIIFSLWHIIRVDVVALLVLVLIGITKLLPPDQLFSGFSSEAVMSIIAIMIIGAGIEKSGLALRAARWILKIGREHPQKVSTVLMFTSGLLSGFMRSLGTVALLLPVVSRITARTGMPKSRLLIPMAFCAILGGTLTMVGSSPLIILNSLLKNAHQYVHSKAVSGFEPFNLFSVFPIGLVMLLTGIGYFVFWGKKLLPEEPIKMVTSGTTKDNFLKTYNKGGDIFELKILPTSPLVNLTLREFEDRLDPTSSILAVMQGTEVHFPPLRNTVITPNSLVAIMGEKATVQAFALKNDLKLYPRLTAFAETLHPVRAGLCEAVLPPSSRLVGEEVRELHMKRNYQIHVLALLRGQTVYHGEEMNKLSLRPGDTLGMFCAWDALADFHKNPDFVVLTTAYPREEIRPQKIWFALLFLVLSLSLIVWGGFSVSVGLLLGASGMVATNVLSMDEAYNAVSWKTVFLVAGLIPLGLVMQVTDTTDWLAQHVLNFPEKMPLWVVQTALALLATLFSFVMSGVGGDYRFGASCLGFSPTLAR